MSYDITDYPYILKAVEDERRYQERKRPGRRHEVGAYLTILRALLTRAETAYTASEGDQAALHELRKLVAVAWACFEQHGVPERQAVMPGRAPGSVDNGLLAQVLEIFAELAPAHNGPVPRDSLRHNCVVQMSGEEFNGALNELLRTDTLRYRWFDHLGGAAYVRGSK